MILVKKLLDWCYKEKTKTTKPEIIERKRFYVSCNNFFLHSKAEKQHDCIKVLYKKERA